MPCQFGCGHYYTKIKKIKFLLNISQKESKLGLWINHLRAIDETQKKDFFDNKKKQTFDCFGRIAVIADIYIHRQTKV